jgi:hypothetical protein
VYEDRAYAAERARESYKYYYMLRYPHDENEWARGRRRGPLDARLAESGAVFGEKNGWERPNHFEPDAPAAERGRTSAAGAGGARPSSTASARSTERCGSVPGCSTLPRSASST